MEVKKYGIKGFDSNLKCRDYQYVIGVTYEDQNKPKLCSTGFHYSHTIEDCYKYYNKDKGNRYCIIEVLGETDLGIDKSCTNKIKIIRELNSDDFNKKISSEELAELCEYGFIIGGSLALKLQGFKIDRESYEIDLIIEKEKYDKIKDQIFIGYKKINRFSGMDSVKCFVGLLGLKYDILIGETKNKITVNKQGYNIELQNSNIIWEHKLRYALKGSLKHSEDILKNGINFQIIQEPKTPKKRFKIEDSLPF